MLINMHWMSNRALQSPLWVGMAFRFDRHRKDTLQQQDVRIRLLFISSTALWSVRARRQSQRASHPSEMDWIRSLWVRISVRLKLRVSAWICHGKWRSYFELSADRPSLQYVPQQRQGIWISLRHLYITCNHQAPALSVPPLMVDKQKKGKGLSDGLLCFVLLLFNVRY